MSTSDYEKRIEKLERARDAQLSPTVVLVAKYGDRDKVVAAYVDSQSKAARKREQLIIVRNFFCVAPLGSGTCDDATPTTGSVISGEPSQ